MFIFQLVILNLNHPMLDAAINFTTACVTDGELLEYLSENN